jgi:hypothetical protein
VEEIKDENLRLEKEAAARERYPGAVLPSEIPKMLAESKHLPKIGHWNQGRLHLDKNAAIGRPHGWHDITYNKERVFDDELEPVKPALAPGTSQAGPGAGLPSLVLGCTQRRGPGSAFLSRH